MAGRLLTFVTGNPRKLEEVVAILGDTVRLVSRDVDLPELQGEPDDIAKAKCLLAVEKIRGPVIVEDTCLCFNALQGLPGPYIKWFLSKVGHKGLNQMLSGFDDKTGYALCTFAYCEGPDQKVHVFSGRTNGCIVEARGPLKFGWDPIFQPEGFKETYAEMKSEVKNSISHRYKAICKLKEFFSNDVKIGVKRKSSENNHNINIDNKTMILDNDAQIN